MHSSCCGTVPHCRTTRDLKVDMVCSLRSGLSSVKKSFQAPFGKSGGSDWLVGATGKDMVIRVCHHPAPRVSS